MKIKVSMERKITSAIISILSCILLFLCGPLLYNIPIPNSFITTIVFLIAGIIPFIIMLLYYNILRKKGNNPKEMIKTIYTNIFAAYIVSFIFKLVFLIIPGIDLETKKIMYRVIELIFLILFIYGANIQVTRSPEEVEQIRKQQEEIINRNRQKK